DVPHVEIGEVGRPLEREARVEGNDPKQIVELRPLPRRRFHVAPRGGVEAQEEDGPAAGLRNVEEMLLIRLGGPPRARRQDLYDASVELPQRPAERDALLV